MGGSARSRRNHTLLCLMTVYGIHGVLFHVISSPPVLVTSVIVKPALLRSIISKSRTSSNTSFYNQSSLAWNTVKNNVSVQFSVTYHTRTIEKNVNVQIRNKSDSSSSEVPLYDNVLLENKNESYRDSSVTSHTCLSSQWIQDLLNSTSSSVASDTLSVMTLLFSDVTVLKILSPSTWGVFIGCLVFVFTSTDYERDASSR